jgi:site-specific DNA-methyltransferase (adenine-specific)
MSEGHKPVNSYTKKLDGTNYGKTRSVKGGGSTSRYPNSVLDIPVVNNDSPNRIHPTQKPEDLAKWFIITYTSPGDLILDPTAGSGSTCLAAKSLGRNYIGFELDPQMAEKANGRLL